jgi:hypothetical protein
MEKLIFEREIKIEYQKTVLLKIFQDLSIYEEKLKVAAIKS